MVLDKQYNYLRAYETDVWARNRGTEPIEFDWSRVCTLDCIEMDKDWAKNPVNLDAQKKGIKTVRVVVCCPNPKHGYFKQVMSDPPTEREYKCSKCVTEEMDRIIDLRAKRERDMKSEV